MSDTSRPQRIEVLKSSVEEMRAKLSPTRAQIEQMMGIMQQLLQAKSADGGQQEEKAGGSGRGDANDNSSDAGRAPREEGAAGMRVGATTESAEGGKMSSHSSRTLDESRPADDTGRRPEVSASVGPIINMASTAAVAAAAATTAVPAITAVTATTAGTFPRSWGYLRGT